MSIYIHKKHNVNCLLYHIVCPTKYRRVVITEHVDQIIKDTCEGIAMRYDLQFLEVGTDKDHVHFLIQSIPMMLPKNIVQIVKSITARQVFALTPEVKKQLWGGEFWSDGYYIATVSKNGTENVIRNYVKEQGRETEYSQLAKNQLRMFDI